MAEHPEVEPQPEAPWARLAGGGVLMGLANLVPGVSGGTMLLAAGVYRPFIEGVASLTTLRPQRSELRVLGVVGVAAAFSILLLAGTVKGWVVDHRWLMYSLFIGLTLGGVPVLRAEMPRTSRATWAGLSLGLVCMIVLALLQGQGLSVGGSHHAGVGWMFLAGVVGAGAMVMPGVSGAYLLLLMGVYVPVLAGIDLFKEGLLGGDAELVWSAMAEVGVPVGLGVLVGVAVVSRGMRSLLMRYGAATHGMLMGLLLGAVFGLWPFQEGVPPQAGDLLKGTVLTAAEAAAVGPDDWATVFFMPDWTQVGLAGTCVVLGMVLTTLVARLKAREP